VSYGLRGLLRRGARPLCHPRKHSGGDARIREYVLGIAVGHDGLHGERETGALWASTAAGGLVGLHGPQATADPAPLPDSLSHLSLPARAKRPREARHVVAPLRPEGRPAPPLKHRDPRAPQPALDGGLRESDRFPQCVGGPPATRRRRQRRVR